MSPDKEIKYDFEPYDGTPGVRFEKFEEDLFNHCASTDDRGYSLADYLSGVDEGGAGPNAPALPNNAAANV